MSDKNIYKAPPERPPDDEEKYMVDLTMAEARRRTVRSVTLFIAAVITLLAGVLWLVWPEPEDDELAFLDYDEEALLVRPRTPRDPVAPEELRAMALAEHSAADIEHVMPSREELAQATGEMRLAQRFFEQRAWEQAEEHVRNALAIYPQMGSALRMLGVIFTQRGQFDQAIQVFEEALVINPFSAEIMNNMATAYMQRGLMDQAEEALQTALRLDPNYLLSYLNLGLLYLAKGEYALTVEHLEHALPRVPREINVRNNLAVALLRLGRYQEARHHLRFILQIDRHHLPAHFNIAITYVLEGDFDTALEWIEDGAQHASPVQLQQFLSDQDFAPMRDHEGFQRILQRLAPKLPSGPGSGSTP